MSQVADAPQLLAEQSKAKPPELYSGKSTAEHRVYLDRKADRLAALEWKDDQWKDDQGRTGSP